MKKQTKYVDLTQEQVNELIERINANNLTNEDRELCADTVHLVLWLQNQLRESKLSVKRLRSLFGMKTEKKTTNFQLNQILQMIHKQMPVLD